MIYLVSDEGDVDPEGENNDRGLGKTVPDYSIYGRCEPEKMFVGYTDVTVVVPSEVLHYRSTHTKSVVEDLSANLDLHQPYQLRTTGSKDRVCFPGGYEIGVCTTFFDVGLQFPLDENVESIFSYYGISLCRYTPTSV